GLQATDADVLRRRWLLIDADPQRSDPGQPGEKLSATDSEKAKAREIAEAVRGDLRAKGWPEPVLADSGNGYHLLSIIDLPADDRGLVKGVLKGVADRFDTDAVKIDHAVFNPSRICKLYGTLARKGEDTEDRPYRETELVDVPGELLPVRRELLEQEAAPEPV